MIPAVSCPRAAVAASLLLAAALPAGAVSLLWETADYGSGTDTASVSAAAADASGNLFVAGTYEAGADLRCKVVKFAAGTGAVAWERYCPVTGAQADRPAGLAVDGGGNAILAIRSATGSSSSTSRIVKYAAGDGAVIWDQPYGMPASGADSVNAIALDAAGNVLATGSTGSADAQWTTAKYAASSGTVLWSQSFNPDAGGSDEGTAIAVDGAGNVLVSGGAASNSLAPRDVVTLKYDGAGGAQLWSSVLPALTSSHYNDVHAIGLDAAGDVVIAWTSVNVSGGKITTVPSFAVPHVVKYAGATGATQWSVTPEVPKGTLRGRLLLAVAPAGDAFVSTTTWGSSSGSDIDLWTARFAGDSGQVRWSRRSNGPGDSEDEAGGITLDAAGNPVVTGRGANATDADILALKYAAGDGALVWQLGFDGSGGGAGLGRIPVAVAGAVLVAGDFQAAGSPMGWRILKLSDTPGPAPRVAFDFNADGRGDFLFRIPDGTFGMWLMEGLATTSISGLFGPGSGVSVRAVADFDGNGTADLLWEHPTGFLVSLMDGPAILSTAYLLGAGTGWTPAFTGDFDGDGSADIVLRHLDGTHVVLVMQGTTVERGFALLAPGSGWNVVRVSDFDGDGLADVVIRHPDGSHAVVYFDGFAATDSDSLVGPGTGQEIALVADFDGMHGSDLLWRGADGSYAMQQVTGFSNSYFLLPLLPAGSGLSVALAADFDGDRRDDLLVVDAAGTHVVMIVRGYGIETIQAILGPGSGWTAVASRDTDGDGRADLLLRRTDGVYAIGLVKGTSMPTAAGVVGPPWVLAP
ncbi:MAG: FG-GAP-like repeat-containing protein [Burkholderiales bacterium]